MVDLTGEFGWSTVRWRLPQNVEANAVDAVMTSATFASIFHRAGFDLDPGVLGPV
jgi:hypothetical protein